MKSMKDYCDNETSRELKELGFPTKVTFIGEQATIEIPINSGLIHLYEAQKWLREEKKIEVNATYDNIVELHWHWYMKSLTNRNQTISNTNHDSYEQALLAGIKEAVKILKEK